MSADTPPEQPQHACCAPQRGTARAAEGPVPVTAAEAAAPPHGGWRALEGGVFLMGCAQGPYPEDGEGPVREVSLSGFEIAATAVTNAEFAVFVESTGYATDAERYGWTFVFEGFLPRRSPPGRSVAGAPWWRQVHGADWRHPEGPGSGLRGRYDHPVVHVSHDDALAYCRWAGVRLPTEAEWEYAARGGLAGKAYPWGDEREPGGEHRMNVWQGSFPDRNTAADGYLGTCPVDAFPPNGYGLHNMTGNVWEWCADWFNPRYHRNGPWTDPTGPRFGQARVLRGGSHLCHESYCLRYRTSARMGNSPDSSSGNTGFRVAR
ncbi:formylglycine-generating enzyme required for sulfatase activity [Lipingzhangella halophila]|uniref:Formylglycine-generating enzyme required for sulfatase activity n=1 Tax=Lipingzhangella halophila TaxID=1783352 RepID=A0A7W7RH71_9ACTN|nr:formylglycine-generating enzyme family protein [Lipingzhangella halophila]MBB4931941.1 formylglycine-generating enzyme required for sulfatase activity [Lipingzhangella halophila]